MSSAKMMPVDAGIPLASLNPDIDGNGIVEPWEKEVFAKITAADKDNTGKIPVRTLLEFIVQADGIPIKSLNPDSDGDGKVEKWELEVFNRIQAADADQSGSISQKELFSVIKGAAESDKAKRLFRRLFGIANVVIVLLIGAMFAVSMVAGELVKESHVKGSALTNLDGNVVRTSPATVSLPLVAAPALPTERLTEVNSIKVTFVGAPPPDVYELPVPMVGVKDVERIYTIVGVTKISATEVYFMAAKEGHFIHIQAGMANVTKIKNGVVEWTRKVCESSADCAALQVETSDEVEKYLAEAEDELVAAGHLRRELSSSPAPPGRLLAESQTSCPPEICDPFREALAGCEAEDLPTPTSDALPACVKRLSDTMGVTDSMVARGLTIDCASFVNNQPSTVTPEAFCSAGITDICPCLTYTVADICPVTCGGRRRLDEEAALSLDEAFEGLDTTPQLDAAGRNATRRRLCKSGIGASAY